MQAKSTETVRGSQTVETEQEEKAFASEMIPASSTGKKFFTHLHLVHKGKTKVVRAQIDSASMCLLLSHVTTSQAVSWH